MDSVMKLKRKKEGFALLVVLWVMVLITIVAFELSLNSREETQLTGNYLKYANVNYGARSALESIIDYIMINYNDPVFLNFSVDEAKMFYSKHNECYVLIKVTDEDRKLNIRKGTASKLGTVFKSLGVAEEEELKITDCIDDWIDPDFLHRFNGAEDDYYQSLSIPYSAKDAPLSTLFELLFVKGVTPDIFYGKGTEFSRIGNMQNYEEEGALRKIMPIKKEDAIQSTDISSAEKFPSESGFYKEGMLDYLRVSDKININKATKSELEGLGIEREKIEELLKKKSSIRSMKEVADIVGSKSFKSIKNKIEVINKNIFNVVIESSSDDKTVKERIYAKILFDFSAPEKFKFLEYKEGF